jgi:hypothetical protein
LVGNCSHVIDKYISYTYPFLPVGVKGYYFRRMFVSGRFRAQMVGGISDSQRADTFRSLGAKGQGTQIPSPSPS